jgi:hydrogenase-1 operon protein HyaF
VLDLATLPAADLRLVEDSLGAGEVSIQRGGAEPAQAQETRLAGVWRAQERDADGRLRRDVLEVSDIPGFVRYGSFDGARDRIDPPAAIPDGVMNAPGVLAELSDALERRDEHDDLRAHVVNLTLLPLSEQDLAFLAERLGTGTVLILSRGYGNCRITATATRDIWWVQHYNSDDRLILNTLEVTDVPEAALAAQEDIEDSAERLGEILAALQ